jgi:hypothetical protein
VVFHPWVTNHVGFFCDQLRIEPCSARRNDQAQTNQSHRITKATDMTMQSTTGPRPSRAENQWEHIGQSAGCANHDHDLVHELSRRLDAVWRYDQFIANAEHHKDLQACWRDFKNQEMDAIKRLKGLMKDEISKGCF